MEDQIVIFGEHEEKTLAQIKNCAKTADRAVLCADGHLGYGVPIGGVVAYHDAISPSGVGYDIGCFVGDQRVALVDGRDIPLSQLVSEYNSGKENFVYSLTADGAIAVDKVINPRQTRTCRELIKIYLDNGEIITCTPDHIFYRRSGGEASAEQLRTGDSLMPLYIKTYGDVPFERRTYKNKRMKLEDYLGVYNPSSENYSLVHHLSDEYNIACGRDLVTDGPIRHHVNFNKFNNAPDNLKRVQWGDHFRIHSVIARERALTGLYGFQGHRKKDPDFYSKLGSDNMTALHKRPDFRARLLERAKRHMVKMLASDSCAKNWKEAGKRGAPTLVAFNKSEAGREQSRINGKKPRHCSACGVDFLNQSQFMRHWFSIHRKMNAASNHKVVNIERVVFDDPVQVYCLTAEIHHNFALSAGVFVHNCGNLAVRIDADAKYVRANISKIMDEVWSTISFGVGRKNNERPEAAILDNETAWQDLPKPVRDLRSLAAGQLGTVGSGNHYVDIFVDENERIWIGVHFGSRGFGHKTATHFLHAAGKTDDSMDADPCVIPSTSELFADYIVSMHMAGAYAYEGREWVCARVAKIMGANVLEEVHNHHNFAHREAHFGSYYWVVRKGSTQAFPGQKGFVGGSMGENSVILEGVDSEQSARAMYSTVHGAGRVMGRIEAKGKTDRKTGEVKRVGKVTQNMMDTWVHDAGVELRGAGVDESPHCYKRLKNVLEHHTGTVKILHQLTPLGVAMAGNEFDPYRD